MEENAVSFLRLEDSPFTICPGKSIIKIEFNEKLNIIFIGSSDGDLYVVDPILGEILDHIVIDKNKGDKWDFSVATDCIVVGNQDKIGIRNEYNGIFLLDTILQTPVTDASENIQIELSKTEAETLCQALNSSADSSADIQEVEKNIKALLNTPEGENDKVAVSIKKEKWTTIKLEMQQKSLESAFQSLVADWCKKNVYIPPLGTASSILDRAAKLLQEDSQETETAVDKSQMFSESARLNTFSNWPHMDYKWALPEKMAQAGFYHNPSVTGDDRSMCFACKVCLVSWEQTDEPWSEHERHSPFCPFVRGEHIHNVPLSIQKATAPAYVVKKTASKPIIGKSSYPLYTVVAYPSGLVLIWDGSKQQKDPFEMEITSQEVDTLEPVKQLCYTDIEVRTRTQSVDLMETAGRAALFTDDKSHNEKEREGGDLVLSAVSILGIPKKLNLNPEGLNLSPSLVVACKLKLPSVLIAKGEVEPAFILIYRLNFSPTKTDKASTETEASPLKVISTGSKQEGHESEDDLFGSYTSECDLLSDSISIFEEVNMSDTSGTLLLEQPLANESITDAGKLKLPSTTSRTSTVKTKPSLKASVSSITVVQKLGFPTEFAHYSTIRTLIPTFDSGHLIVIASGDSCKPVGAFIVYNVVIESNMVMLDRHNMVMKPIETDDELPVSTCLITSEYGETELCYALRNGSVRIVNLFDLSTVCTIQVPSSSSINNCVTSVSYCTSLGRLYCGTDIGRIEVYSFGFTDVLEMKPNNGDSQANISSSRAVDDPRLIANRKLLATSLKQLFQLTLFENIKPGFAANAPPCWLKVIQAQKERKHPQHLQHLEKDNNSNTLSWRLQRTKNSKTEHLFEITLPHPTFVGHVDLKIIFQLGCKTIPDIEVTLYRIMKKKCRRSFSDVDSGIDFSNQLSNSWPSNDRFLQSVGAEIVCGPLDLASYADLSCQSANIVMTSPALILSKTRNFYVQIKANLPEPTAPAPAPSENITPAKPGKSSSKAKKSSEPKLLKSGSSALGTWSLFGMPESQPTLKVQESNSSENLKQNDIAGCDWLHELSISIRQVKPSTIPNEYVERKLMLTSSGFISKLIEMSIFRGEENSYDEQNIALDLLVWIASVNLCGPQIENNNYQANLMQEIQSKLRDLILRCVLTADRSVSHKCARLLVICMDAAEINHSGEETFLIDLLKSLLELLPFTILAESAGSLQWFFLLLSRVKIQNLNATSEALLNTLTSVSDELNKRANPLYALLRTRFGLYGLPLDADLFELELPPFTKSHSMNCSGIHGLDSSTTPTGPGLSYLWGLKDIDFRELLMGNSMDLRWGKIGSITPKQQIQGLLEVEPLHFSCHAASDGTRIEKIDSGTGALFSTVSFPQPYEPFTNLQTGEGSKKSEPDKMEQILMLQKALKMDHGEAYFDMLNDLKYYENNDVNPVDKGFKIFPPFKNMGQFSNHLASSPWKNEILTVVVNPSKYSGTAGPSNWQSSGAFGPSPQILCPTPYTYTSFGVDFPGISNPKLPLPKPPSGKDTVSNLPKPNSSTSKNSLSSSSKQSPTSSSEADGLRLLLSPWQQMMYVPPQQALVIDRMHSGARRFVVLDFGSPILLTDLVIPSSNDLVSMSIDIWLRREEIDGQRLIVASDIGKKPLVICDLQPSPVCRYLKITVIGRYGMGNTKCRIPIGMFYGHTTILPNDLDICDSSSSDNICVLTPSTVQAQLSVLSYLVEDLGCRYQLAGVKLKRLLEPLMNSDISSLDHISSYLPKGKEKNKSELNGSIDQSVLAAYQESTTLQQQLNVAKNVIKRLQKSLLSGPEALVEVNPINLLTEICTDKIRLLNEFLVESLLGASFIASQHVLVQPGTASSFLGMTQQVCENLFYNICVLGNSQCQLSTCALMLRSCGFQPWWGKFLASALKSLFSSSNNSMFPQDRVFMLLAYLGQRSIVSSRNLSVLESIMELLQDLLMPLSDKNVFLRAKVDMTLLGWIVMYLCFCLDCINCTTSSNAESNSNGKDESRSRKVTSSRWDFIQGECALFRGVCNSAVSAGPSVFKRRIQKKILATKQKLEELDSVASGLGYSSHTISGVSNHLTALGNKIEAIKQKQANVNKFAKSQSSKNIKDALQSRRNEMLLKYGIGARFPAKDVPENFLSEMEVISNLDVLSCVNLAKNLGSLLLHMDSTCHSDIYLIVCKTLAKIGTCCNPTVPLGAIFTFEQVVQLFVTAVGNDFVKQRSWSSSWISHAIICLFQDILEGERNLGCKAAHEMESDESNAENCKISSMQSIESTLTKQALVEDMIIDDAGFVNEAVDMPNIMQPLENNLSVDSEDSDYLDVVDDFAFAAVENKNNLNISGKITPLKRFSMCLTSISTALDARLETRVESTTELRLRLMSVADSEILTQSLKSPTVAQVPEQYLKTRKESRNLSPRVDTIKSDITSSTSLLSSCFDHIFLMLSSENSSISLEKLLQLWIAINLDPNTEVSDCKPRVPLSRKSISSFIRALSKNAGVGVQEWGLGFQCLALIANQRSLGSEFGDWHHILCDENFAQLILRFISGFGLNIHQANVASVGPTVCQHFYNFLFRLRELSSDSLWTLYLKEVLLRVLDCFLQGPVLNGNFPVDAFNKFLDRVCCPDLSYESLPTVISIVQNFVHILHQFVFYPSKLKVRSSATLKHITPTSSASLNSFASNSEVTAERLQDLENIMLRLSSLVTSIVGLPFKSQSTLDKNILDLLSRTNITTPSKNEYISECITKCGADTPPKTIADLVLQMDSTIMRILSALANPNGINLLLNAELASSITKLDTFQPVSFVDSIAHLFNKLCNYASQPHWTVQPLFKFLSKSVYDDYYCPLIVSDTFVLLVLKVINQDENLQQFVFFNCVQSICEKLVASTKNFFSSCPTFVSILTQYVGRNDATSIFGPKNYGTDASDMQEGLINVAPLGSITSTNFSAHPAEVLLQPSPPHRRARSPIWSYHFFPEESFLELIITLPCAFLLNEVQIVPHTSSLSTTSPSAVMLEISRERNNLTIPMGPPIHCSGMTTINIQLNQAEVAQTILIRLYKPKDSCNLGLSQIRVLGSTTFSEAALIGLSQQEDLVNLESSAHWMYILDRALEVSNSDLRDHVVSTAVNFPNILESCYSLLMAPPGNGKSLDTYLPHVANVLFHFGSCRKDISEQLMSALLGPVQIGFSHGMVIHPNAKVEAGISQLNTVVELIYNLCCNIPMWGYDNIVTLIDWVKGLAEMGIEKKLNCKEIVPEYIQGVAAAIWTVAEERKVDLSNVITPDLLRKLFNWASVLDRKSEIKAALDHMICSVCFCKPWLFIYLMNCMKFVKEMDWIEKDQPLEDLIHTWYEESAIWERVVIEDPEIIEKNLSAGLLMTLGRAAQSPLAAKMLHSSQLLTHLNSVILDFITYYTSLWINGHNANTPENLMSTSSVVAILEFFGELCSMNEFKNWFGLNGTAFWLPMLKLLSVLPGNLKTAYFGSQVYDLEAIFISFLSKCCWTHPDNQDIISNYLCETILNQKSSSQKAVFLHSMSSFCRRLLIQLLLENEKLTVHIKTKVKFPLKCPNTGVPLHLKHPSMGVCGGDRIFLVGIHSNIGDMLKLLDPFHVNTEMGKNLNDSAYLWNLLKKEHEGLADFSQDYTNFSDVGNIFTMKKIMELKRPIKMANKKLKSETQESKVVKEEKQKSKLVLECVEFPDCTVPLTLSLSSIMSAIRQHNPDSILETLVFNLRSENEVSNNQTIESNLRNQQNSDVSVPDIFRTSPITSTIEVFSRKGGLALLSRHLPVVYPDTLRQIVAGPKYSASYGVTMNLDKDNSNLHQFSMDNDWVKIENAEDFYEEMMEGMVSTSTGISAPRRPALRQLNSIPGIPPHSLAAFGLFLGLPRFADILLGEREGSQCMLRLVMGVTDDADGNNIFGTPVAKSLPTLPFNVLRCLLDVLPLCSDDGIFLRRAMVDMKAMHFILACLAVFTHQNCDSGLVPGIHHELVIAATKAQSGYGEKTDKSDDKSHVYWAKGTGFGTGSTAQSWDIELAMQKKQVEEENVACFFQVLSSFIRSDNKILPDVRSSQDLLSKLSELLKQSCLFPAIASYLRNDSVLDMARHIPLYKAVLLFLRSLVSNEDLLPLLLPTQRRQQMESDDESISSLLSKMKTIVDNYSRRLTSSRKKPKSGGKIPVEDAEDEGLAVLIPDIQSTAMFVEQAVNDLLAKLEPSDVEMMELGDSLTPKIYKSLEDRYVDEMKQLQFAFFDFTTENDDGSGLSFTVSYHYESHVKSNFSKSYPARLKRLAQESVTLSNSLPIAYGSTIFVRSDTDRLDVMKVLITGPAATPYSNGCFEFDVYFPSDYPNSPMMVNLETTGRQRVRFNPNLYSDGKVCLSILNTWHGRPEEKWNSQTSSLLTVLVAIQSLILTAEPYFNEPGYEKSRGTESGQRNSREYNAGIQLATLEWAMLEQLRHPSACFKEIIQHHFWLKRNEIIDQCEQWLADLVITCQSDKKAGKSITGTQDPVAVFKNNLAQLKKELSLLTPIPGCEELNEGAPLSNQSQASTDCQNQEGSVLKTVDTSTINETQPEEPENVNMVDHFLL